VPVGKGFLDGGLGQPRHRLSLRAGRQFVCSIAECGNAHRGTARPRRVEGAAVGEMSVTYYNVEVMPLQWATK